LTAVCTVCFNDAAFTLRTVEATQIELIGGAEAYRPVCRACYLTTVAKPGDAAAVVAAATAVGATADASKGAAVGLLTVGDDGEPASPCAATHTPHRRSSPAASLSAPASAGAGCESEERVRGSSRTPDPSASAMAGSGGGACAGAGVGAVGGMADLSLALAMEA